jgi:hypothetical protein
MKPEGFRDNILKKMNINIILNIFIISSIFRMPPKENKTADKKAYAAEYRRTHPKNKEEQNAYMKTYIAQSVSVDCPVCGGKFKSYNKYHHDETKKHQEAEKILKAKGELKKREEEEAAAQAKALAEAANKKLVKGTRLKIKRGAPPKKKGGVGESPQKENIKMEIKEKERPTPAPRKKKEEEKPKEKAEALKALEEYGSSSEEEEEKEEKIEDVKFRFQSKKIDSEAVAKYIEEHHEGSVNPDRATDTKTKRLNKNKSLWRKVSAGLDGQTFKYLGDHFGEIVSAAYDKPSSQADFIQMLKMVVIHFTPVPVPEQKRISMLARKLKSSHVSNQK